MRFLLLVFWGVLLSHSTINGTREGNREVGVWRARLFVCLVLLISPEMSVLHLHQQGESDRGEVEEVVAGVNRQIT